MSGYQNGNWHNANGGGLPFRPPTVDEALPYSPFTSIVPFSPDIIPFPSNEPPTPPTILSPDQQNAANRAVELLNNEIRGPSNVSQHLQQTFQELQNLLNPDELPQFNFKPATQLATPPESPADTQTNGSVSSKPSLSPFASMLLKQTNVDFVQNGVQSPKRPQQNRAQSKPSAPRTLTPYKTSIPPPNGVQNPQPSSVGSSSQGGSSSQPRTGAAVVIKPSPSIRREEYQRYDAIRTGDNIKKKNESAYNATPTVTTQQLQLVKKKVDELQSLLDGIAEETGSDHSDFFEMVETDDGGVTVIRTDALTQLSDAVAKVVNFGYFPNVATESVLHIQSLCEPLIAATTQMSLELMISDDEEIAGRLLRAQTGLRACKLALQTMTEGSDDRQACSEDLIQSIVRLVKYVLNSCITPVVESRRTGSSSELFESAARHKSGISDLLRLCGNIFSLVAVLLGKINLTDFTLSPIESISIDMIFIQNAEKEAESVLGIKKVETFRQKAMDVLAQIAAFHPDQRGAIVDEVLLNLERLPAKRTSARHFKSAHDDPIMLVSALFMRIVQAAGSSNSKRIDAPQETPDSDGADSSEDDESEDELHDPRPKKRKTKKKIAQAPGQIANLLWNESEGIAGRIANTLVARAENVSKSGDKPYRNILDLFMEDLCNVLGSPEWPAATILLYRLLSHMVHISENAKDKSGQAVEMAIATMGNMGCGIIDFTHRLRRLKRGLDIAHSEMSARLIPLADGALARNINRKDVLAENGPYRMVLDSLSTYLHPQGPHSDRNDPYLRSLSGYYVTAWTIAFHESSPENNGVPPTQSMPEMEKQLKNMLLDKNWSAKEYKFRDATDAESQLAAGIITLQGPFCKYLRSLIIRLIRILDDHHAKAKIVSRAMTGLSQMMEKDPQIVDAAIFSTLGNLMGRDSPMVRANTLSLLAKCLEQDASLAQPFLPLIVKCLTDDANGPKKRAIELLRDIYKSTKAKESRLSIAKELLLPARDEDKTIAELGRHTLWEIWLKPLNSASGAGDSQVKLSRQERVSLLVDTVQNIQNSPLKYLESFETFYRNVLSKTDKQSSQNFGICKEMVGDMVDGVISPESTAVNQSQARILQTLSVFARIDPRLFTTDQVQLLKAYVTNLSTTEDLAVFRPTVVVFRYVFPVLSTLQEAFLEEIWKPLFQAVTSLANTAVGDALYKDTLLDVAHCVWTIHPLLKGDPPSVKSGADKLMIFICSLVTQIASLPPQKKDLTEVEIRRSKAYTLILGAFGKVCDFDRNVETFGATLRSKAKQAATKKNPSEQLTRLTVWSGKSITVLLLDLVLPFTKQTWDLESRRVALSSIGEICQQKTKFFTRADIEKAFKLPFINKDATLTRVVLTQFLDFLAAAERRSDTGAQIAVGAGATQGAERLETSFTASDNDHATTHIARTFLREIVNTALGDSYDLAFSATGILASISRQGLLHPKECGAALVALSTSTLHAPGGDSGKTSSIAIVAAQEQKNIHLQHETMFEKEYVTAVDMAFDYHCDVLKDPHGALGTFKPKMQLLFGALKEGTGKSLKSFITNVFRRLHFDLPTLNVESDASVEVPRTALYTRFCLENFAFFDYGQVGEVYHVIATIESIVLKQIGPTVALAIETEMTEQQTQEPAIDGAAADGVPTEPVTETASKQAISDQRLRHLAVASMILHMMWETRSFLRKAYNLQGKITANDMKSKAIRNNLVKSEVLWDQIASIIAALDSQATMRKECYEFAEIINVDREHAVADDEADAKEQLARAAAGYEVTAAGYETPDEGPRGESAMPTSGRGRKRKSSAGIGNTPKKPRGRPAGSRNKKRNSRTPDEDSD